MSTGLPLIIIIGLGDFLPRLYMAYHWGKWFKTQLSYQHPSCDELVAANRAVFIYYCVFVVIFLITVYSFIGAFISVLKGGGTGNTEEEKKVIH